MVLVGIKGWHIGWDARSGGGRSRVRRLEAIATSNKDATSIKDRKEFIYITIWVQRPSDPVDGSSMVGKNALEFRSKLKKL